MEGPAVASVVVAVCQLWTVQAQAGPYFPIKRENLYDSYRESVKPQCVNPRDLTLDQWEDCMRNNVLSVDYTCRYSLFHYDCYCCGAFFHYIEQGRVCTKYCLKLPQEPEKVCQPRVIILPFNFGDNLPEEITLDGRKGQGSQVPIPFQPSPACPTDPLDPDRCYGPRDVPLSAYWDPEGQSRNVSRQRPQNCSSPAPLILPSRSNKPSRIPNNNVEPPRTPTATRRTTTRRITTRRTRTRTTTRRTTTTTTRRTTTTTTKGTTTRRATTIIPQKGNRPQSNPTHTSSQPNSKPISTTTDPFDEGRVWSSKDSSTGTNTHTTASAASVVDIRANQ